MVYKLCLTYFLYDISFFYAMEVSRFTRKQTQAIVINTLFIYYDSTCEALILAYNCPLIHHDAKADAHTINYVNMLSKINIPTRTKQRKIELNALRTGRYMQIYYIGI
jgi:hypothetical protein